MSAFFSRRSAIRSRRSIASPGYLLEWAVILMALFLLAHVAGLREFTSVLNGTIGSTSLSWQTASFLGAAYIFLYLGVVVVVPVLILAAGILKLWQKAVAAKRNTDESAQKS